MKKILWIGDAGCPSGFARATHEILDRVRYEYDVTVLGINYRGDPHRYPYPIYAAAGGEDSLGVGRINWMCKRVRDETGEYPHAIVIQNDGWFIPYYVAQLRRRKQNGEYAYPEHAAIPIIAAVAVDGKNFRGEWIKDVTAAVFWTRFAQDEARAGGFAGRSCVIPLGVDLEVFKKVDRAEALERRHLGSIKDRFIVGSVNRNQYRKRWDLTLKYFAEWVHTRGVKDAQLYLHTAPTGDESVNVQALARYYGILDRLALCEPELFYGETDEAMRDTYNCFDVGISTTQGEGMGLTTMEAMACGVPCIVPDWAALGDWAKRGAALVPCSSTALQSFNSVNGSAVIGGIADERLFIEALDALYRDRPHLELVAQAGLQRVSEPRFRWQAIGEQWVALLDDVLRPAASQDDTVWQEIRPLSEVAQ